MIIAVDLDGMLISYPEYFQFFFKAYQAQGAKVGILTNRPESQKDEALADLEKIGIHADFYVGMPDKLRDMGFSGGIFKALVCNHLGIDVLYDDFNSDDASTMGDFFTYNQGTKPFTSFTYNPEHEE